MYGIFHRSYNHQGELRWRFIGIYGHEMSHTHVERFGDETVVTCRIKKSPKRAFTFCKPPAYYM